MARAPSNLRCGPGTVTSDGITDVVQRVPVTCEEIPSRERGELPVVEGVRRHLLSHDGRWQLSLSQNLEESDRTETTFLLCLSTCRSCERTFGERNTSRGDHLHDMHSNGAHNRFLAVGAMYGAPCAKAKKTKVSRHTRHVQSCSSRAREVVGIADGLTLSCGRSISVH